MSNSSKNVSKPVKNEAMQESSPAKSQVVRLSMEHSERVGILAERFGVTQAQIMRWALDALFTRVDACGGRIVLPLVFGEDEVAPYSPLHSLAKHVIEVDKA